MANKTITNEDILFSKGLIEYEDPIDGLKKQVTIEMALRIAKGNLVMRRKLEKLGVSSIKESTKEDNK